MSTERLYYLDRLRVLATGVVLLFHVSRYFDQGGWLVKNPELSQGFTTLVGYLSQWMMPLFFLISAMSTVFMLQHRPARKFLVDRARRLLIPLLFASLVVVSPIQIWVTRV